MDKKCIVDLVQALCCVLMAVLNMNTHISKLLHMLKLSLPAKMAKQ